MAQSELGLTRMAESTEADVSISRSPTTSAHANPESGGNYRWVICALLFFAATINYMDRQIIGLLKPVLANEFHWSEDDYGNIISCFQLAYAIGLFGIGGIIDRIGVKRGFSLAVIFWSIAAAAHGFARSVTGFCVARFGLGLAESGNFPASIKSVGDWFPRKERALATGLFNSGTNVGALITPLLVPWLHQHWGWQAAFFVTGALGLIWVVLWWLIYEHPQRHARVTRAEMAWIASDPPDPPQPCSWAKLLGYRQTWAFALGKLLTDPFWWFYLFWVPSFLNDQFGVKVNPKEMGLPMFTIYALASIGSVGGGWISSRLIGLGWSVNRGRKTAMLACALAVVPIIFASRVSNVWSAVFLIGLAAAAHQGFSANLFTLVSDIVPRKAVGSVVGIGGMAGAVGGMFIAKIVGHILQVTGKNYLVPFFMAGFAYLAAILLIHVIVPRLQQMELE
jgi:MFS transporter, ACS family, hexuronate transporter